jgi:hypothetical protein
MNGPVEKIVVVDLRIPFFRLVMFFVKATLAAIPAVIILGLLAMVVTAIIAAALGAADWQIMMRRLTL